MSFQGLEPSELFPEVPNLYEFLSVHANMVLDKARVDTYDRAIRSTVAPGDVVMDIGTGTGLLAFMAIDAGASKVYAIERVSKALRWAEILAKQHGYGDRIVFLKRDSRTIDSSELPEKADVVISELIGHVAFEEGMVESMFHARDSFLKPSGKMIPQKVQLVGALVVEQEIYRNCIDCWGPIGNIDYTPLRDEAVNACYLTSFSDDDLLSLPSTFLEVNLSGDYPPILVASKFLRANRRGSANGLALWFNATLAKGVVLSSSPWQPTHWKQCFAPNVAPIDVEPGDSISVSLSMRLRHSPSDQFDFHMNMERV